MNYLLVLYLVSKNKHPNNCHKSESHLLTGEVTDAKDGFVWLDYETTRIL